MTPDPDALVACFTCGRELPAGVMAVATVVGVYQCGRCWGEAADDDEFEDADEHTRD